MHSGPAPLLNRPPLTFRSSSRVPVGVDWMLRTAVSAVLAIGLALPVAPACAQREESDLYIGLLLDSEPGETDSASDLDFLREEIHKVLGAGRSVHFLPEHLRFGAGRADYLSLATDPAVDLIISVGPASAAMLAALGDLPKPTIAVGILDVELLGMPLAESGVSGVPDFTYVLSTHAIEKDLEAFHRIHPFSHLAVIVSETLKGRLDFEGFIQRLAAPYGVEVELVFWGAETPLPVLSDAVDAVYLTMVFERRPDEVALLAAAIAERKLPSFAMSRSYVDAGMMACIASLQLLMPGEFGVFLGADTGRVFFAGDPADAGKWHTGAGGGFWLSFLHRRRSVSVAVMDGAEMTGLYVRAGFLF